jgi:hypothetical protein
VKVIETVSLFSEFAISFYKCNKSLYKAKFRVIVFKFLKLEFFNKPIFPSQITCICPLFYGNSVHLTVYIQVDIYSQAIMSMVSQNTLYVQCYESGNVRIKHIWWNQMQKRLVSVLENTTPNVCNFSILALLRINN